MVSPFQDDSVLQNQDGVGMTYGGKPMGDDEGRPSFHEAVHPLFDVGFGTGVDGRGRFVQDQDLGVGEDGPRDVQQLSLALGKFGSVETKAGLITLGMKEWA